MQQGINFDRGGSKVALRIEHWEQEGVFHLDKKLLKILQQGTKTNLDQKLLDILRKGTKANLDQNGGGGDGGEEAAEAGRQIIIITLIIIIVIIIIKQAEQRALQIQVRPEQVGFSISS